MSTNWCALFQKIKCFKNWSHRQSLYNVLLPSEILITYMILGILTWLFPLILTFQRRNFMKKLSSILMLAFNLLITPSMSSNLASAVSASLIDKATLLSIFWSWSLCCRSRSSPRPLDLKKVLFTKKILIHTIKVVKI